MADKDEFSFEADEMSPSGEQDLSWMDQEGASDAPGETGKGRKGSMTRVLLLVLLLVAVGGAGFYYMAMMPEVVEAPPPAPPVAVKKQPIAVPPRPAQAAAPIEKVATSEPAEKSAPEAKEAQPPAAPALETKAQPEKGMETAQSAPAAPEKSAVPPAASESPEQVAPAPTGEYAVAAGAFLLRSNLAEAEKALQKSGFEPQVVRKKRKVEMTRLRIGVFPLQEVRAKMAEVAELAPDAFYLPVEGGVALYAASFQDLDKARLFADRLYKEGLRTEEEYAKVDIPLYLLSFGEFADLASARKAAEQVRSAGLETAVVRKSSL